VAAPTEARKSDEKKAEEAKRAVAFERQRAEQGKASFQYDLGKRYLTGDGVEKDLEAARKWFSLAASQSYPGAKQKLEEVEKLLSSPKNSQ
jgi:TPR repeat protein